VSEVGDDGAPVDGETVSHEIPVSGEFVLPTSADWNETWTNVGIPTFFGAIVGAIWQLQIQARLGTVWPNPVQAALLAMLLFSPLFHRWLTPHEQSKWMQYSLGVLLPITYLVGIWFVPGLTGMFCGGYLASILWIWMCTSWWRFNLPPFRSALWHTLGVNIGALGGSVLTYNLFL
tara:strand:+ start:54028 stop:54555 length:528 start_codon:yes stop_codon:yes gene_type:complete